MKKSQLRSEFEDVATISFGKKANSEEVCVVMMDDTVRDEFLMKVESMNELDNQTAPVYVPDWTSIEDNNGPFNTDAANYRTSQISAANLPTIVLTPKQEAPLRAYAERIKFNLPIDDVYKRNFWRDYAPLLPEDYRKLASIDELNITDLIEKMKIPIDLTEDNPRAHEYITIDGERRRVSPFALFPTWISYRDKNDPERGSIKFGPTSRDIVVNVNKKEQAEQQGRIYVPGAEWASKWKNPNSGKWEYSFIEFPQPEESEIWEESQLFSGSESELEGGEEGESMTSEWSESGRERRSSRLRGEGKWMAAEEREGDIGLGNEPDEDVYPDFSNLTEDEMQYLPLSYVPSLLDQWTIVQRACESEFSLVSDMSKVTDNVLALVADACAISTNETNSAAKIIEYAIQRNV